MPNSKNSLKSDILRFSAASYMAGFATLITHFATRRLLEPVDYGIWVALQVVFSYAMYSHLGLLHGLQREAPIYLGQENKEKVINLQNTVFTSLLILSIVAAIGLLLGSFLIQDMYSVKFIWGLRAISLLVVLQQIYNLYFTLLQCHLDFVLLSKIRSFLPIILGVLTIIFVWRYNVYGMYLGAVIAPAIMLFYIRTRTELRFKLKINFPELKSVFKVGISIFSWSSLSSLMITLDVILIGYMIGPVGLGYYSIVIMVQSVVTNIPRAVSISTYPRILREYSANNEIENTFDYVFNPPRLLALFLPILLGFVYISLEPAVSILMPKYVPGIAASKIILFGIFFMSLRYTFEALFIAKKYLLKLTLLQLLPISIAAGLGYVILSKGGGLESMALVMSLAYFIYFSVIILYTSSFYAMSWRNRLAQIGGCYLPFIYFVIFAYLIDFIEDYFAGSYDQLSVLGLKILLYLFFCLPLLKILNDKTNLVSEAIAFIKLKLNFYNKTHNSDD